MEKKRQRYIIKGMNRDLSLSKSNNEYSFENKNIRILSSETSDALSIINEKSTKAIQEIKGTILGQIVVEDYAIIFSKGEKDYIYKFQNEELQVLVEGCLNFNLEYPIEAICDVEASDIHKVYWVDGINIARSLWTQDKRLPIIQDKSQGCITYFDFSSDLELKEILTIKKQYDGRGLFPSGTIQYAFSYFNSHGKESPIVNISPLFYLTHKERGASGEESTTQSFVINIDNLQRDWDYLRLYSIIYTSLNGTPLVRRIKDIKIESSSVEYIDSNLEGSLEDPTKLLFLGGESIIPYSIASKDNVLFIGNYKLSRDIIPIKKDKELTVSVLPKRVLGDTVELDIHDSKPYTLEYSEAVSKHFKRGETYELGVVFQNSNGKFSSPVKLTSYKMQEQGFIEQGGKYIPNMLSLDIQDSVEIDSSYKRVIPIIGYPKRRRVLAQGVLNPTVFNFEDRGSKLIYSQPSWFFRANPPIGGEDSYRGLEYSHYSPLPSSLHSNAEIISNNYESYNYASFNSIKSDAFKNKFYIDREIISMYSPDVSEDFRFYSEVGSLNIIGIVPIHSYYSLYDINLDKAPKTLGGVPPKGLIKEVNEGEFGETISKVALKEVVDNGGNSVYSDTSIVIFPFHNEGGAGQYKGGEDSSSVISSKILYNYRKSKGTIYKDITSLDIEGYNTIFNSEERVYPLKNKEDIILYKNNINKILTSHNAGVNDLLETSYKMTIEIDDKRVLETNHSFIEPIPITYKNYRHIAIKINKALPYTFSKNSPEISRNSKETLKRKEQEKVKEIVRSIKVQDIKYHPEGDMFIVYLASNNPEFKKKAFELLRNTNDIKNAIINPLEKSLEKDLSRNSGITEKWSVEYSDINPREYLFSFNIFPYNENGKITLGSTNGENKDIHNLIKSTVNLEFSTYTPPTVTAKDFDIDVENIDRSEEPFLVFGADYYYCDYNVTIKVPKLSYKEIQELINRIPKNLQGMKFKYLNINPYNYDISFTYDDNANKTDGKDAYIFKNESIKTSLSTIIENYLLELTDSEDKVSTDKVSLYSKDLLDSGITSNFPYLLLGELISREDFQDTDDEFIDWKIAGEGVLLSESSIINYTVGDTFYHRYNCPATLPRSNKDTNQIVDVISFMVESNKNIEAFYDNNHLVYTNFNIEEESFNKENPVYNRNNSYFNFPSLNKEIFNNEREYLSTVSWSLVKNNASLIDPWTSISGVNSLSLEGEYGKINRIFNIKDSLITLQDRAISTLLFNSRVQIPTSDAVPIEIANSNKMDSYRYISTSIGCRNKWASSLIKDSLLFLDDNTDTLYSLSEGLQPLSDRLGFRSYFYSRKNKEVYSPLNNNMIFFSDNYTGDLYIKNEKCLVFSSKLNAFESFLDYDNMQSLFSIKDSTYSISQNTIWKHRQEGYCNLYGKVRDFYIDYKINFEGITDKIFTNLELRGDSFEEDSTKKDINLKSLYAYTEYQKGTLLFKKSISPSNLKNKFRIWRMEIPREKGTMNRIRNPWCGLKILSNTSTDKTIIHDLIVTYYE